MKTALEIAVLTVSVGIVFALTSGAGLAFIWLHRLGH